METTESTSRQYALRERARALGWPDERIVVIDQDLGHSGASTADPSRIKATPMPSRESEAMSVVFLPRLRGTLPLARSPYCARADIGVKAMLEPLSSINTSDSLGSLLAFARQVICSSSLRSVALSDFFSRPAQPCDRPAHRKALHMFTVSLFPPGTVLRKRWHQHVPVTRAACQPLTVLVSLKDDQGSLSAA
jgi:hypothetical protein